MASSGWFEEKRLLKTAVIVGSGAAVVGCLYAGFRLWRQKDAEVKDEGFVDVSKVEDASERKVLVLGLDSAGKSTLLSALSQNENRVAPQPTEGFNVVCLQTEKSSLNIWEVGGAKSMRKYWSKFIQDTNVLMYVVDSHEEERLPEAFDELHKVLADERLAKIPIVVVAAKQDGEDAQTPSQVLYALGLDNLPNKQHKVQVIGTSVLPTGHTKGVEELENTLTKLCT